MTKIYESIESENLVVGNVYVDTPCEGKQQMKFLGVFKDKNLEPNFIFKALTRKCKYKRLRKEDAKELGIDYQYNLIPFGYGYMYREIHSNI